MHALRNVVETLGVDREAVAAGSPSCQAAAGNDSSASDGQS